MVSLRTVDFPVPVAPITLDDEHKLCCWYFRKPYSRYDYGVSMRRRLGSSVRGLSIRLRGVSLFVAHVDAGTIEWDESGLNSNKLNCLLYSYRCVVGNPSL